MTVDGVEIAYLDRGNGAAVILCHCSSASHKEWLPLIEALESDWRVLAPDFIGYGQSGAWPEDQVFTGKADVDVLLALAKKTTTPSCISSAIPTARRWRSQAARELGAKVQEPRAGRAGGLQSAARRGPSGMGRDRAAWACRALDAVAKGEDREAAAPSCAIGSAASAGGISPEKFKAAITATIRKVALEFMIALDSKTKLSPTTRAVNAPTLLIAGSKTRRPPAPSSTCWRRRLPNAIARRS